jgi:SOS response regulatory protein OraA/RecX
MPRVTALRPAWPGHVLVELDGERWRTVSLDVAARSGLSVGLELDRDGLRTLRRELRRDDALTAGVRALGRRDRSEQGLRSILERKGVGAREREEAVATLRRHGALDDERFARARATALAERGFGDAAIAFRLDQEGIGAESSEAALAALEPECDRALRLAAGRGASPRTARWLAGRGFASESIEAAVAQMEGPELGYEST